MCTSAIVCWLTYLKFHIPSVCLNVSWTNGDFFFFWGVGYKCGCTKCWCMKCIYFIFFVYNYVPSNSIFYGMPCKNTRTCNVLHDKAGMLYAPNFLGGFFSQFCPYNKQDTACKCKLWHPVFYLNTKVVKLFENVILLHLICLSLPQSKTKQEQITLKTAILSTWNQHTSHTGISFLKIINFSSWTTCKN